MLGQSFCLHFLPALFVVVGQQRNIVVEVLLDTNYSTVYTTCKIAMPLILIFVTIDLKGNDHHIFLL